MTGDNDDDDEDEDDGDDDDDNDDNDDADGTSSGGDTSIASSLVIISRFIGFGPGGKRIATDGAAIGMSSAGTPSFSAVISISDRSRI